MVDASANFVGSADARYPHRSERDRDRSRPVRFRDLAQALAARPRFITNVDDDVYDQLDEAFASGTTLMCSGWPGPTGSASPGRPMARAGPLVGGVERPHKPPAYEQIPADLRVDHVYLLSCKYGSKILQNASPANLFDRALNERRTSAVDWFDAVAPTSYGEFYTEVVAHTGLTGLPPDPTELTEIIGTTPEGASRPLARRTPRAVGARGVRDRPDQRRSLARQHLRQG